MNSDGTWIGELGTRLTEPAPWEHSRIADSRAWTSRADSPIHVPWERSWLADSRAWTSLGEPSRLADPRAVRTLMDRRFASLDESGRAATAHRSTCHLSSPLTSPNLRVRSKANGPMLSCLQGFYGRDLACVRYCWRVRETKQTWRWAMADDHVGSPSHRVSKDWFFRVR